MPQQSAPTNPPAPNQRQQDKEATQHLTESATEDTTNSKEKPQSVPKMDLIEYFKIRTLLRISEPEK